jgi:linoleate 10R-lipoxygenase
LRKWLDEHAPEKKPETWTFGKLKRVDGAFRDADLVNIMTAATDAVSGAFGARNTPVALRAIEMLGITQGRQWGLASLNEFRQFFKLKPFNSFKEINSQPGIAETCKFSLWPLALLS